MNNWSLRSKMNREVRNVAAAFAMTMGVVWTCVWVSGCWLADVAPPELDAETLTEPEARQYLCTLAVLSENEHAIELCDLNARVQAIAETMAGCQRPH